MSLRLGLEHKSFALLHVALLLVAASEANAGSLAVRPQHDPELVICENTTFALCASSTCTPTGGTITGNAGIRFRPRRARAP